MGEGVDLAHASASSISIGCLPPDRNRGYAGYGGRPMVDRRCFVLSTLALAACWKVAPETAVETPTKLEGPEPLPGVTDLPKDPDTITPLVLAEAEWKAKLAP